MVEVLDNGHLRLRIDPALGASVIDLEACIDGVWQPVCVSESPAEAPAHAGQTGLFFMLPFANRARANLLIGDSRSWTVEPTTDEPLSLHGMVWIENWTVQEITDSSISLGCRPRDGVPYPFDADLAVAMEGTKATFRLTVTPRGFETVPVGMGFHPYFPSLPGSFLTYKAEKRWLEGSDYLPTTSEALGVNEGYGAGSLLPPSWQNNCFTGWDGTARINQPDLGYALTIQASPGLRTLMVYSTPDLDRFAVEPQSHLSGCTTAGPDGLRMIDADQSWSEEIHLQVCKHH